MKNTSRQLMDLRLPYIKLIIVLGLITWIKDYQKIEEVTQYLKIDAIAGMCRTNEPPNNNADSATCTFPIFEDHRILHNQNQ
ncbi:MAG TPA: hypothetical protein VK957_19020 [Lunatimonas sp.]|nr:hypothetical protein [Lunatimonas sp.]